jgi:hypothetical protein
VRTTVSIDDHLLRDAKQRALDREVTLSVVVEDALRAALGAGVVSDGEAYRTLPASTRSGGTRPGVEITNGSDLRDLMDGL